jgi:chaperonin GroES
MKIKPLNDWAVIVPSEAITRTTGGIIIPETVREKPAEGTVEAIGPGALEEEKWEEKKKEKGKRKERKFIPTSVKPGERIMYDRYAGKKIDINGEERVLVREKNILGILPPLMLPAATSTDSSTALAKRTSTSVTMKKEAPKPVVKKAAKKTSKKETVAKPKKAAAKKTVARKTKKKR